MKAKKKITRIKDLETSGVKSVYGVRFRYPGDGKKYYWISQWNKGVWGKEDMSSSRMFPLFCNNLSEALEWEVVK